MMKSIMLIAGVAFVAMYLATKGQSSETYPASEVRVIDGDTIAIGDERYRLIGFDTPETFRAHCDEEQALGDKATRRLKSLLGSTDTLTLEVRASRDRYNRKLARAFVFGEDVANIMITEGLARAYGGGKREPWCSTQERASREAALAEPMHRDPIKRRDNS